MAATAVLAVALGILGLEARQKLDEAAQLQRVKAEERIEAYSREQQQIAVRALENLVLAWVRDLAGTPVSELADALRDPGGRFRETGIVTRTEAGELELQVLKPQGSQAALPGDEAEAVQRVFATGQHQFFHDVLFHPYYTGNEEKLRYVLRLQLEIPPVRKLDLPPAESADLGPLALAAFSTLALAMLAVFVMLMFALRKFVLAPLGNVLQDSERIVKGASGLEVRGLLKPGQGGDIETLVAAFNAMFSELKAYQSDLEGKVQDATRTIKQQQQSLVIAQRLAATGTLAAGLAHEVNNPLSGMLNAARRLKMREGLDERAKDYVELIEEGLKRIENLMKQILDFSRRRDMKPERFSPEAALKRSVPLVRHRMEKRNLKLEEDIAADVPPVYGNEEEISQVLMNLLINAADAAPEGGVVRASIARSAGGGVELAVEDSGTGVPEDIRDRIFDPFFTTKEPGKGTGLGLAIVHTVVDNHGGTVRVERSAKLGGARFVVVLPPAEKRESTRRLEAPGA
ncbi:MAG: HAMP domain-containing histidine kinase [Planctomycetes bacterium]|nr:HAMP domain-containing histidine kinase [Planctomycetota bacterium]